MNRSNLLQNRNFKLSDFEILEELGKGSHGVVYKANHIETNKVVVLKKLQFNKNSVRNSRVYLETNLLSKMSHPHIIHFIGDFSEQNCFYIVMEYAENGDLESTIKNRKNSNGHFTEQEIWRIASQLFSALSFLHSKNVMHRDIKAMNLFIMSNKEIKLGDFGISKLLLSMTGGQPLKNTKIGTPLYLPPEIVKNIPYDYKVDVWSAGCVLYYLAALKMPFVSDNIFSLGYKIVNKKHKKLITVSKELSDLIESCLIKDPKLRSTSQRISDICNNKLYPLNLSKISYLTSKSHTTIKNRVSSACPSNRLYHNKNNKISKISEDKNAKKDSRSIKSANQKIKKNLKNEKEELPSKSFIKNALERNNLNLYPQDCQFMNQIEEKIEEDDDDFNHDNKSIDDNNLNNTSESRTNRSVNNGEVDTNFKNKKKSIKFQKPVHSIVSSTLEKVKKWSEHQSNQIDEQPISINKTSIILDKEDITDDKTLVETTELEGNKDIEMNSESIEDTIERPLFSFLFSTPL